MHNLGTVFSFEVIRSLKKKSFWIMAIAFPVLISAIYAIVYFSNVSTQQAVEDTVNQKFSFIIKDDSGLINQTMLDQLGGSITSDKEQSISSVNSGEAEAFFYYPSDITSQKVEIYAKDAGIFNNSRYENVAKSLLQASVAPTVGQAQTAVLTGTIGYSSTIYKDGQVYDSLKEAIIPGIFLVVFFILISVFGNQMIASTTEEKENRVIEIILTTIKPKTLIIGKILALLVLAFIQILITLTPVIIAYIFFREQLSIPSFDLSNIPFNPIHVAVAALMFIFSFLLFTGLLVGIGAAAPTIKEASGSISAVMLCMFGPLYAVSLFVSSPDSPLVQFLTFFPLTAPIPLMLRNAVGNLTVYDTVLGILILAISAVIALIVAIRMFQYGALEYNNKISLKTIIKKPAK